MALSLDDIRTLFEQHGNLVYSGEPVTRGHKVIITKWFRVLGDGPVHFD